jgi:hypothetical protein
VLKPSTHDHNGWDGAGKATALALVDRSGLAWLILRVSALERADDSSGRSGIDAVVGRKREARREQRAIPDMKGIYVEMNNRWLHFL